ncbi:MAG TPA: TIGR03936 family radical SAM-associated protein [Gaiellales bacterium]|nr:TIGR03936 family radical SAM-associated protein [Gaiellales bacterium]
MTYRITFAVGGRARFLSHLETVDTLLGALRRAGFDIALSKGMKPRPVISLALPRAVGTETLADLADVELRGDHDPMEVGERLANHLPLGMTVVAVERAEGRPAASQVEAVSYRVEVADDLDWAAALVAFAGAERCEVERTAPGKATKRVDVKRFCSALEHEPGQLRMELAVTDAGTARPEELTTAVAALVGATPTIERLVRTAIRLREPVGVPT